jgi:hypothetical protein
MALGIFFSAYFEKFLKARIEEVDPPDNYKVSSEFSNIIIIIIISVTLLIS